MAGSSGFPRDTRYTPVPSPLLGELLREVQSVEELKCTLRVVGMVHQRRSRGSAVSVAELMADPVLTEALAGQTGGARDATMRGVAEAVARGTLLRSGDGDAQSSEALLFVNDEPGRRAMSLMAQGGSARYATEDVPAAGASTDSRPNIFALYEENIGSLTPLLAEELKEAEETYPQSWVKEAFKEAVTHNHRSWRYIARILERWAAEGKSNGEPGRRSQASDPKEYLRRYGRLSRG
ncbi:MAG: DnaD domain protein [Chloroflexi bacterium]|nr:DnaD domain protein [Chloroflexota bacterium]